MSESLFDHPESLTEEQKKESFLQFERAKRNIKSYDEGEDGPSIAIEYNRDTTAQQQGSLGTSNFFLQTPDVAAVSSLMYAMSGLTKALRLYVSDEGLSISEGVSRDAMHLFAKFRKAQFEEFECEGDCVVCLDPTNVYQCIRGHQQRDILYMRFDKKTPRQLTIGLLRNGNENNTLECRVALFSCLRQIYTAPPEEVDYFLAFDTSVIIKIISTLFEMRKDFNNRWVTVDCCRESIVFSKYGSHTIPKIHFELKTAASRDSETEERAIMEKKRKRKNKNDGDCNLVDSDCSRKVEQKRVKHEYLLEHLHSLQKCFAIHHGYTLMYIKEDFPLVLEIKVGTLGVLRAVLMFRQEGEEDDF